MLSPIVLAERIQREIKPVRQGEGADLGGAPKHTHVQGRRHGFDLIQREEPGLSLAQARQGGQLRVVGAAAKLLAGDHEAVENIDRHAGLDLTHPMPQTALVRLSPEKLAVGVFDVLSRAHGRRRIKPDHLIASPAPLMQRYATRPSDPCGRT